MEHLKVYLTAPDTEDGITLKTQAIDTLSVFARKIGGLWLRFNCFKRFSAALILIVIHHEDIRLFFCCYNQSNILLFVSYEILNFAMCMVPTPNVHDVLLQVKKRLVRWQQSVYNWE